MSPDARGDAQESGRPRPPAVSARRLVQHPDRARPDGRHSWPLRAGACAAAIAGLDADVDRPPGGPPLPGAGTGAPAARLRRRRRRPRRRPRPRRAVHGRLPHRPPAARGVDGALVLGHTVAAPPRARGATRSPASSRCAASPTCSTASWFGLANAHWDGASAASRLRSAEALLGWLDPSLPWLVVGDLNATADDPAVARLVAGGLRDTLAHLGARGPRSRDPPPVGRLHRRHAHRLRARRPRLGRARRPHRPHPSRRAPAVRPLAGRRRRRAAAGSEP